MSQSTRSSRRAPRWARLLPGAVVVAICFVVPIFYEVGVGASARWLLVLALGIMLPGVLLVRALVGRSPMLVEELAWGGVFGLLWQLIGWAIFVALGWYDYLLAWPAVVYLVFLAVPKLRRHWSLGRYPEVLGRGTAWGLTAVFTGLMVVLSQVFRQSALPPAANDWYQDQYWHLALTAMVTRQVVPSTPQVADLPLVYHWFANVHIGATAMAARVDLGEALVRLWLLPVIALLLAMVVVTMRMLTRRSWPAFVAAWLLATSAAITLGPSLKMLGSSPLEANSPSQNYAMLFFLAAVALLVKLLREQRLGRWWIVLGAVLLVTPGMKSSSLPLLVAGLLLAGAFALLRRLPWRPIALAVAAGLIALLLAGQVFGGGAGGVNYMIGSTLRKNHFYVTYTGLTPEQVAFPGESLLMPGLDVPGAWLLVGLLLVANLIMFAYVLPSLPLFGRRPEAWFLLGIGIAGWCAMMLIDHDGMSQVYFMNTATLALHVLTAWGVAELVGAARRAGVIRARILVAVGVGVLLSVPALLALHRTWPAETSPDQVIAVTVPRVAIAAGVLLAWVLAWRLVGRRRRRAGTLIGVALAATTITMGTLPNASSLVVPRIAEPRREHYVTVEETAAARWLSEHSSRTDVVATNVHCQSVSQHPPCDARAFWVGGFTERQMFIEGWAYTDDAHERHGDNDLAYMFQPFADAELYAANEAVFAEASPVAIEELRARGVRWLFADHHRGEISPELAQRAKEVFHNHDVTIYELRPSE